MHGNSITSIENNEAKRWLIIGAHQAGASDKKIARMCGINQPSVRRIILNFQKTGSPSIPRKLSQKEKLKPFIEYDEEGNLIDSEDELPNDNKSTPTTTTTTTTTLKEKIKARRPSAKDLIAYVLNKAQQSEEAALFVKQPDQSSTPTHNNEWRPPTPPRDTTTMLLLQQKHLEGRRRRKSHDSIVYHSPPLSGASSSNQSPSVAAVSVEEATITTTTTTTTIKGFETWTIEDDKILMAHVLTRLSGCRWKEAELKLRGRHDATVCEKRWHVLRDLLIRGANKSDTRGW